MTECVTRITNYKIRYLYRKIGSLSYRDEKRARRLFTMIGNCIKQGGYVIMSDSALEGTHPDIKDFESWIEKRKRFKSLFGIQYDVYYNVELHWPS